MSHSNARPVTANFVIHYISALEVVFFLFSTDLFYAIGIIITVDVIHSLSRIDPKDERVLAVSFDGSATHPIKHAILVLIDTIAGKQGGGRWSKTNDNDDDGESKSNINQCSAIKRSIPYLLTGYDVYVTREPCISCAMALTHSRVRRVFYGCRRPITGGLGSLCKVHAIPELNHRYLVFPDVMTEECRMLTEFQRSPSGLS